MILNRENYFSQEANNYYMSVSQYKQFESCQAAAMAEIQGKYEWEKTISLLVGSYVDAHFEGTLDLFQASHPEIYKRDGTLKSEYSQAEQIINRIERDDLFMKYMSGKSQVIMTGVIEDVPIKIKIDSLLPDKIVDLKVMKDFEPVYKPENGRLPWFEAWRYDLQGAIYQEIVRQNTGEFLPFYLAAATKEKTTDINIVHVSQELLTFELDNFRRSVPKYDAIKKGVIIPERCEKCDFCKETKILTEPTESEEFYNE